MAGIVASRAIGGLTMLISELIAKLEAAKAEHGDLPVALVDYECGGFNEPSRFDAMALRGRGCGYYDYCSLWGDGKKGQQVLTIW